MTATKTKTPTTETVLSELFTPSDELVTMEVEEYNGEVSYNFTVSSYQFCLQNLNYNHKLTKAFRKFAYKKDEQANSWFENVHNWVEKLKENESVTGLYGDGDSFTVNTYNEETDLSDTLWYHYMTLNDEQVIIMMAHQGGDVRGNYSSPYVFNLSYGDYEFFSHGRDSMMIGCKEGHRWYKEGYECYTPNDETVTKTLANTFFGDEVVEYPVKNLEDYTAADVAFEENFPPSESNKAFCPACMLLDATTRNELFA